jgi:Outer membrane protein beta-barrel domain
MKKIMPGLIALIAIATTVNAQTEKGDWMVGGDMSINTTKGNSEFALQPMAGYFFAKSFVAGSEFNLTFRKEETTKTSIFGVGPFARYYFDLKSSDFKPFLHADFNFSSETDKDELNKNSTTITSFFIGAGGAYFINSNVAIEAVAGYNRSKVENLSPDGGFRFHLGFQVHLLGNEVSRLKGN